MTEVSAIPLLQLEAPTRGALLRRRILRHKGLMAGVTLLAFYLLARWLVSSCGTWIRCLRVWRGLKFVS